MLTPQTATLSRRRPHRATLEKGAIWLWLILGGTALAAHEFGVFWWWMVLIVPIPFVILAFIAPTLFLYMSVIGLPYLLARLLLPSRPAWTALTCGVVAALAVGVAVPYYTNRAVDGVVAARRAADTAAIVRLRPVGTIALLRRLDDSVSGLEPCDDDCQRLLFTGAADAVLVGSADALGGADDTVTRHEFVPLAAGCRPYLLPYRVDSLGRREALGDRERPLAARLADFGAAGVCIRASLVNGVDADIAIGNSWPPGRRDRDGFGLVQVTPPSTQTMSRRDASGWRMVARRSAYSYRRLTMPLTLVPRNGADTQVATHWGGQVIAVDRIDYDLTKWLAYDDRVFEPDGSPTPAAEAAVARAGERAAKNH